MTQTLLELDSANRELALKHASFIVEAPAGAGKTELLTQRYLSLLAVVNEPEEIIALTFTNKAAAEMRNRILLSLENARLQTPEIAPHKLKTRELALAALKQSASKQWDILQQPARLRIMTMDALCSSLTRQMPLLSRFGGQPQVSDDAETHYLEAARRAIAQVAHESNDDDTVTMALRYLDNNSEKLTALLARMLAMRDQWLPLAGQLHGLEFEDVTAHTEVALQHLITEYLEAAFQVLTLGVQQSLMPLARFAASNLDENSKIYPLLDWQDALELHPGDLQLWQALAKFLLTQSKTFRKKVDYRDGFPAEKEHKAKKDEFLQIISQLEDCAAVGNLLSLPALETLAESQPLIQALTRLLLLATSHLWAVFQTAGQVDFVAISQSAQQALENEQGATDLALRLDYQISHLLIDEFQDTSPVQMRLIEKLIEGWQPDDGRTLFCVGDPMQSIYRFRKADVSLFLQAAQYGIGHLPLTRLQLTRNNRSHPAVVDWVNKAFKQVFPACDNISKGAIEYREFTASRSKLEQEGVVIHPLVIAAQNDTDDESTDAKQLEAAYVANLIEEIRQKNRRDHLKETRPEEAKKIAVLVRSRSHLRELVSEIRRNHPSLKFQAVEIEHLNDRQSVQDALSLTYAMHHRAERIHWLNILRAPWCGLTLADLHALAAHNHKATIWQLMHDDSCISAMSADGQSRLQHVRLILATAFSNQGRMPVRRWLESTWLQLGGGQCLVDAGDNRDVQAFFDLVEKSSRNGRLDMTALEMGMQKLYAEPDLEANDSLQFLTIHKSKGLEFDTVILPALNRKPRNDDNELVLWQEVLVDNRMHLLAAPMNTGRKNDKSEPTVYAFLKALEAERNINEIVRLLYVAATRSERYLHLVATMQANQDGDLKPASRSLLEMLWPAVEVDFIKAHPLEPSQYAANAAGSLTAFIPKLQRLPLLENPIKSAESRPTAQPIANAQALDNLADQLVTIDLQRHCGTLAHKYMELMAADVNGWHAERLARCNQAMQAWLMQQGHTAQDAELGSAQVLKALQTTLASQQGQWVLHNHLESASELSLFDVDSEAINLHVIDRTFVADGARWVVDYKLTQAEDFDLAIEAEQHRPQLERYAALFSKAAYPVKKAVFFLSLGKLIEL